MSEGGITRKQAVLLGGAGLVVGSAAAAGVAIGLRPGKPAVVSSELEARFHDAELPGDDPGSDDWRHADPIIVPLQPQQIAQPFLQEATVHELVVRALHNGTDLAFLLAWDDADRDDLDGIGVFHDGVAVQLPAQAGATPPITMGGPGAPVHVLQWRATWQRDLAGKTGVDQIYPRVVHDVMPDDILSAADALAYWPGRAVGNPVSIVTRGTRRSRRSWPRASARSPTSARSGRAAARSMRTGGGRSRWPCRSSVPTRATRCCPARSGRSPSPSGRAPTRNRGARKHIAGWLTLGLEAKA